MDQGSFLVHPDFCHFSAYFLRATPRDAEKMLHSVSRLRIDLVIVVNRGVVCTAEQLIHTECCFGSLLPE